MYFRIYLRNNHYQRFDITTFQKTSAGWNRTWIPTANRAIFKKSRRDYSSSTKAQLWTKYGARKKQIEDRKFRKSNKRDAKDTHRMHVINVDLNSRLCKSSLSDVFAKAIRRGEEPPEENEKGIRRSKDQIAPRSRRTHWDHRRKI